MHRSKLFPVILVMFLASAIAAEYDWPQWQGPDRDNLSKEIGLLKEWPPQGPPEIWSISDIGNGYGSVSISGDRIFVQGSADGQSAVYCLNRLDGKTIWTTPLGPAGSNDKGGGPRGTPTIDGSRLYALSENGDLSCIETSDGTPVWSMNILDEFKGANIKWLISESPLVDGKNLIVTPGGKNSTVVALDKLTGKTVWTTEELSDAAGYASCIVEDVQGVRTIMTITSGAGVGIRASDGKLMWRYDKVANRVANIATPVFFNDKVFYTTDYGTGCALLQLKTENGMVAAEEVYFNKNMKNHHGGVVLVDRHIYGRGSQAGHIRLSAIAHCTSVIRALWQPTQSAKIIRQFL
ncbi:MAG: PQQ-like beta-propeller repeat protein [Acidobacteriota bacterium]